MDISYPPETEAFRTEVRAFLAETLPPDWKGIGALDEEAAWAFARDWRRLLAEHRYLSLTWPEQYGGRGLTKLHQVVLMEELALAGVPFGLPQDTFGVKMLANTLLRWGTDQQKAHFLPRILSGEDTWCQGYSEPDAGSDLASLRTRAVRDGEEWVIDGQKVWTSGAQFADYGLLLARTDPDVVKQAGITAFLVPMDAPGVEVRPIRQMSGGTSFNEVFLGGVRVADRLRIGRPGQGWEVANATLAFERTASGSGNRRKGGTFPDVLALARSLGRTGDPLVRQRLADLYVRAALRAATVDRVARTSAAGGRPGPEASLTKLMASELLTRTGQVAAELMGARISADTGEPGTFAWTQHLLGAPGYRLAGGTDQIQRNLIGERVLKLPPEPRVDRAPFSQLPGD